MAFPTNVGTGTVVGRLLAATASIIPAEVVVEFIPALSRILAPAATPDPVTFIPGTLPSPVMGVLDSEGYVCTPDPDNSEYPASKGVELIATDADPLALVDWAWVANVRTKTVRGVRGRLLYSLRFNLPAGGETDLTTVTPIPPNTGGSSPGLIWYGDTEPPITDNYTIWVQPDGTWLTLEA